LSLNFVSRSLDGNIVYVDQGVVYILQLTSPFMFSGVLLDAGENQFTTTASDRAGNTSALSNMLTVVAEAMPHVTMDSVTSPVNQSGQLISGSRDSGATVSLTCPTASTGPSSYPTATSWQAVLTNMQEGSNTISVTATDQAGNSSDAVISTILVDTTRPPAELQSMARRLPRA
jgi:hypothetical protein